MANILKLNKKNILQINASNMFTIVSTRFTNITWEENIQYRFTHGIKGCIYGSPQEMSPKILYDSMVFVVEMNNNKNRIEGIGLIRNKVFLDKYYKIYDDGNYNRYVYKSDYHIDRDTLIRYNEMLVNALDYILFKGYTHLKRGSGFTTITEKLLNHEKCQGLHMKNDIRSMFIDYYDRSIGKEEPSIEII
jgi:hypothetical protein